MSEEKLYRYIKRSMISRYSAYLVQVIGMMVTARVFSPEEFGVLVGVQVFVVFFSLVSEMGIAPALINQHEVNKKLRDGVFSFSLSIGLIVAIIFYLLTPVFVNYIGNDIYYSVTIPIAISIIFSTSQPILIAAHVREKKFGVIGFSEISGELCFLLLVAIYFYHDSFNPFVVLASRPLIFSFVKFLVLYISSKYTLIKRPTVDFKCICEVKKILNFSKYQFLFEVTNYFSRNLDRILVSNTYTPSQLGVYDKAFSLMRYPILLLSSAMSPAIQPVMKEFRNNSIEFARIHNSFINKLGFIAVFISMVVGLSSEVIVGLILGSSWSEVAPIMTILSLSLPVRVLSSTSGAFYQASGEVKLLFRTGLISAFNNIIACIVGINLGTIELLTWCLVVSFIVNFIINYFVLSRKVLKMSFVKFIYETKWFFISYVLSTTLVFLR